MLQEIKDTKLITGGTFKISSFNAASGCTVLKSMICNTPDSVAVDARNWSPYSSGVFSNCTSSIKHAVLLVGIVQVDRITGQDNWKIKNSWGTGWGKRRYIRLASGNTCGICNYPGAQVQ